MTRRAYLPKIYIYPCTTCGLLSDTAEKVKMEPGALAAWFKLQAGIVL